MECRWARKRYQQGMQLRQSSPVSINEFSRQAKASGLSYGLYVAKKGDDDA